MPAIDNRSGVLQHNKDRASPGYTLFTPIGMFTTYLIDMDGNVVHEWKLPNELGHYAYLLENGNLLASGCTKLLSTNILHLYNEGWLISKNYQFLSIYAPAFESRLFALLSDGA